MQRSHRLVSLGSRGRFWTMPDYVVVMGDGSGGSCCIHAMDQSNPDTAPTTGPLTPLLRQSRRPVLVISLIAFGDNFMLGSGP